MVSLGANELIQVVCSWKFDAWLTQLPYQHCRCWWPTAFTVMTLTFTYIQGQGSNQCLSKSFRNILVKSRGSTKTHYDDVIMSTMDPQVTSFTVVCSNAYSGADQRKHQSSASLAFVRGIHRWPVNSPHKGPVTRKMFPFDDVIMSRKTMTEMMIIQKS